MSLLDELQRRLREGPPVEREAVEALHRFDATFYRCLDELGRDESLSSRHRQRLFQRAHERWSAPANRYSFVANLRASLRRGLGVLPEAAERLDLLTDASIRQVVLEETPTGLSLLERAEVQRLSAAHDVANHIDFDIAEYLARVGLMTRDGHPTESGAVFQRLVSRDALVWLLAAELVQVASPNDLWLVSKRELQRILSSPEVMTDLMSLEEEQFHGEAVDFPSSATLKRLDLLRVLRQHSGRHPEDDYPTIGWTLTDIGTAVLTEVLADSPSPLVLLARSTQETTRAELAGLPTKGMDPNLDFARMITHELRNALGPLRISLDQLHRELPTPTKKQRRALDRAMASATRIEDFAEETADLVTVGVAESVVVDVLSIIQEALQATQVDRNGTVKHRLHVHEAHVRAPRKRFVTALVNLIRNAAQAAPPTGMLLRIEVSGTTDISLIIDDDGPGVPATIQARLFERGVSGRGSSGQGLAFVRTVIEHEMGGQVRYIRSDRGGARFELTIPAASPEST